MSRHLPDNRSVDVSGHYAPVMTAATQVFVVLAGALHLLIFTMESVLFGRPQIWRRFLITSQSDADTVRPWALNQGFYNLFLAIGAIGGVLYGGDRGEAVALFACGSMVLAGVVLIITDRRMLRAGVMQAALPLVALVLAAL
jgi:putative membrane protein